MDCEITYIGRTLRTKKCKEMLKTFSIENYKYQLVSIGGRLFMKVLEFKKQVKSLLRERKRRVALVRAIVMGIVLLMPAHGMAQVEINEDNFPDAKFRHFVDSISGNKGELSQTTIDATTSFGTGLEKYGVSDLTGLKYFTNLTTLDCQNNPNLTSIDLSSNTKLQTIKTIGCKITSLDFSNNPAMTSINCSAMKTLTSIDVSKCTNLQELYVPDNKLTTLDVTNCPKLTELSFYSNNIASIDLSKNTVLKKLDAFNNAQLTSLDLTNNTNLTYLSVYSNNMSVLDVSKLTKLQTLLCFGNKLTTLDLSNNTALQELSCYKNQLKSLDLSKNTALIHLDCHSNKLESLTINPADDTKMNFISVYDNALSHIDLSNFTKLAIKVNSSFAGAKEGSQKRTAMLYTDGTDAYLKVSKGIDASKISDGEINISQVSTPITFTVGTEADANGFVPLKFSNGASRKQFFNWNNSKASAITITYNYNTGSKVTDLATMDVTNTVLCYMLPMSAEYGSVNLPYNVTLPAGATAYAVTATDVKAGSGNNTATLTQIATEGETVATNTPMLIRRSDSASTLFALNQSTATSTPKAPADNLLRGTTSTAIDNREDYYVLGLNNATKALGFWRSDNSKIGTWRAYLDLSRTGSNAKGFILALDTDTPTGITNAAVTIKKDTDTWYTLDGIRLNAAPTQKGIYIHQGKKIVITK